MPCNNQECPNAVVQPRSGKGRPRAYCSERCRIRCGHRPELRRREIPKRSGSNAFLHTIHVAFAKRDLPRLTDAAARSGLTVGQWLRELAIDTLNLESSTT